jgi:hypothetical protein
MESTDSYQQVQPCPFEAQNLQSNFKTGAINRSATPPGEVVRAYFRISQAMGKVDRAVSLGAPWSGEGGLLDAKNTKTTRQLLTFR